MIELLRSQVNILPVQIFIRNFVEKEWCFTERGLDCDLDTLKDALAITQGECIISAKPKGEGMVSVTIKMRKGQVYENDT